MEESVKVVIASHKRAAKITTHKRVSNSIICVAESQFDEYKEHCKDVEIVCHSDKVIGISAKRQWIYERFGNVFSLDDDLMHVQRVYVESGEKSRCTPDEAYSIIQATARTAKAAGVFLFGFNTSGKPYTYSGMQPIQMSGYVNTCAFGLFEGSKLYFRPEQKMNEDYWLSGLNAYYHRKIWRDNRFYFHYGETWTGSGGLAEFRNTDALEQDLKDLQHFFGKDVIVVRKKGTRNHPFQMNFKTPF